ncbi:MAG: cell division protein FtsA [Succinivibrionaceae bacterium]
MISDKKWDHFDGSDTVVAIDMGTSEIRVSIASIKDGYIHIHGNSYVKTTGITSEGISNIEKLKEDISTAYASAFSVTRNNGVSLDMSKAKTFVTVPGKYIKYKNNFGTVDLGHRAVTGLDVDQAINIAKSYNMSGYDLISSCSHSYDIDENHNVENPRGIIGGQLYAHVHLIYANSVFLENLKQALIFLPNSEYDIEFTSSCFAASFSLADESVKELGCCILDIGCSYVDIVVYDKDRIIYTGSSNHAGKSISRDIAVMYGVSETTAEKIKTTVGCADKDSVSSSKIIDIEGDSIRGLFQINKLDLAEMIDSRYSAIFAQAIQQLNDIDNGCELGYGFILAGGATRIDGIKRCFQKFLENNGLSQYASKVNFINVSTVGISGQVDSLEGHGKETIIGLYKYCEAVKEPMVNPSETTVWSKLSNWWNNRFCD